MSKYVLDSFAMLAYFRREANGARVQQILGGQHERWMSFINVGEVLYKTSREFGQTRANDVMSTLDDLPITLVDADRELTVSAAAIKAVYPVSYADCFAAALAQTMDAAVVTGDPEFRQLEQAGVVSVHWLTPKTSR